MPLSRQLLGHLRTKLFMKMAKEIFERIFSIKGTFPQNEMQMCRAKFAKVEGNWQRRDVGVIVSVFFFILI